MDDDSKALRCVGTTSPSAGFGGGNTLITLGVHEPADAVKI